MRPEGQVFRTGKLIPFIPILMSLALLATAFIAKAEPLEQTAGEGQALFEKKCVGCHTIGGGKLIGPDLQGVATRRDRAWLVNFISAPDKVMASGDPLATQLLAQYNNIQMPNLGLSKTEVEALLAYLESPGNVSQPASTPQAQTFTGGDPVRGEQLFNGRTQLASGGLACMSCHNVGGVGMSGGGSLGPDLTHVAGRLGQPGLASALQTIPFPTMQGIFANQPLTPQEQADLLAFLTQADAGPKNPPVNIFNATFFSGGVAGMLALFGILAIFWPRQRTSLSEKLRKQK